MLKATLTSLRAVASTVAQRAIIAFEVGQFILVRRLLETPLLTDAEVRAFFKVLNDEMSVSELASLRLGKVEADAFSLTDDDTLQFGKVPSDTTLFVDAQALSFTKVLGDTVSITDLLERTWVRFDTAGFADSDTKAFGKVLNEVYALDYFAEDYANEDEAKVRDEFSQFLARALGDGTGLTDLRAFHVGKSFSDGVTATDDFDGEATTEDDQEIHFVKVLSHSIANSDAMVVSFSKNITESPGVTDAGNARGQNYSDFDYFAEDYVGYSWTF